MPYESPAAILFDVNGIPMSVSGGVVVPVSTSALLIAGVTSAGTASHLKTEPDGTLWVTGSFSTVPAGVTTVTGTVALQGLTNVSGALPVFISASNLLTVTGSISVTNIPTVTGSITVPNTVAVTGSVTVPNLVTVTGSVGINGHSDPDATVVGALNALNAAITLNLSGAQGAGFQLLAGTLVGTIIAEISYDDGTTWEATGLFDIKTNGLSNTIVFSSANGTINKGLMTPQGAGLARVRVSAYTSGTATGQMRANHIASLVVYSSPLDGRRTTYGAATAAFASAATATDIFIIQGSATKLIRVLRIQVYATQTTAGASSIFLIKRSTANTAGTAVAATKVPFDSSSPAATATVQHYTANPTVGALVGNVQGYRGVLPQATSLIKNPLVEWEFGTRPGQAVVLRGTAEGLAVNLNGVTVTGGSFIIVAEWTEE